MDYSSDDIRVNPYSQIADRVQSARDDKGRRRRERQSEKEEPQDVVELHDADATDEEELDVEEPADDEDGLDLSI